MRNFLNIFSTQINSANGDLIIPVHKIYRLQNPLKLGIPTGFRNPVAHRERYAFIKIEKAIVHYVNRLIGIKLTYISIRKIR